MGSGGTPWVCAGHLLCARPPGGSWAQGPVYASQEGSGEDLRAALLSVCCLPCVPWTSMPQTFPCRVPGRVTPARITGQETEAQTDKSDWTKATQPRLSTLPPAPKHVTEREVVVIVLAVVATHTALATGRT